MSCQSVRMLAVTLGASMFGLPSNVKQRTHGGAAGLPWYVNATAVHRVTLKPSSKYRRFEQLSLDPASAREQMSRWKGEGTDTLEVFAPEQGGNGYDGLDSKNRYRLDPGLGTMTAFRRMVKLAHALGFRVVTLQNLGYSSVDAAQFEAAEDKVRKANGCGAGQFYYWSKQANAAPPALGSSYFSTRQALAEHTPGEDEAWQWSARAQAHYWKRGAGKDSVGNANHLPQYNWSADAWPEEATRVVHCWMDTGLDGMILDAVNWYSEATWQKVNRQITQVIAGYGDTFIQPEGGGAFSDDPVGWITEGGLTNIYDYGLGIWWEKENRPLLTSDTEQRPELLDQALSRYHDRVVATGGTLYFPVPKAAEPGKQTFVEALIATSGDPCYCDVHGGITKPAHSIPVLLRLKAVHTALFRDSFGVESIQAKMRRLMPRCGLRRIVQSASPVVFNFSNGPTEAAMDAGAIDGGRYVDMLQSKRRWCMRKSCTSTSRGMATGCFRFRAATHPRIDLKARMARDVAS